MLSLCASGRADRLEISHRHKEESKTTVFIIGLEAYEIHRLQTLMLFSCLLNCSDETTQHSDKLQYTCLRLIL